MITFKQYLAEAETGPHKKALTIEEADRLISANCKDALASTGKFFRGMTPGGDAYVIEGAAGGRTSRNTTNYYTVIMDHLLPAHGYPKRGESIIFSNDDDTARGFGALYIVFPYDGVKIGVCSKSDLWYTDSFTVGDSGDTLGIKQWNNVWAEYGLPADSYESFVSAIKEKMAGDSQDGRMLTDIFGTPGNVEPALKKAYSPQTLDLELATTKRMDEIDGPRELWASGKMVAVRWNLWYKYQMAKADQ